jgi:hypothetical protein
MEGLALTGAWVDKEKGLLSLIALEMDGSSDLCAMLKPGEPVIVMGPTGAPTVIEPGETVVVVGGGLGNAVLFSIGQAFRKAGSKVLYFAGYKRMIDRYKVEEIEAAADVVVWCCDEAPGFEPGRPQDKSVVTNIVEAMRLYASGELGELTHVAPYGGVRLDDRLDRSPQIEGLHGLAGERQHAEVAGGVAGGHPDPHQVVDVAVGQGPACQLVELRGGHGLGRPGPPGGQQRPLHGELLDAGAHRHGRQVTLDRCEGEAVLLERADELEPREVLRAVVGHATAADGRRQHPEAGVVAGGPDGQPSAHRQLVDGEQLLARLGGRGHVTHGGLLPVRLLPSQLWTSLPDPPGTVTEALCQPGCHPRSPPTTPAGLLGSMSTDHACTLTVSLSQLW